MEVEFPQILFQIINFSVVLGALTYLLYKPIRQILDERAAKIEEGQQAAQDAINEKAKIEEIKKQSKREAEKEAARILDEAKKMAQAQTEELMAKAQEHAKAQVLKFQADWQAEKKQLVQELKAQYVEAVMAATKKVGLSVTAQAQSKLIDEELDTLVKSL